jgi:sugar lactone lactonase YvrE
MIIRITKALTVLLLLIFPTMAPGHPGGGLIAVDANTVIFGDSMYNTIWRIEKGKRPHAVMKNLHAHWTTLGLDGRVYSESFQEMGGALFRIDLAGKDHVKVAEESHLNAHVFAVGRSGELIFQRDAQIVERRSDGSVKPFRGNGRVARSDVPLQQVIAYAWSRDGTLYLADGTSLRRIGSDGVVRFVAGVEGKLLEPKIWNSIDAPRIWSISIDDRKRIYTALPDTGQVVRIDPDGTQHIVDRRSANWRVTAVATYRDSVFLLESSDNSNAGQRVRVLRGSAKAEVLGQVEP